MLSKPHAFSSSVSSSTNPSSHSKPPCLTENEHSLLFKHVGCLKCCHGYQNHHAPECPNNFPDSHNYKELTEEALLSYKCANQVPYGSKPVNVVSSSTHSEETSNETDILFIAGTIMPSTVLGTGSESEEEVSAPPTIPHL